MLYTGAAPPVRLVRPWPDHFFSIMGVAVIAHAYCRRGARSKIAAATNYKIELVELMASSSTCPGSSSVNLTVLADSPHQPKSMIFFG